MVMGMVGRGAGNSWYPRECGQKTVIQHLGSRALWTNRGIRVSQGQLITHVKIVESSYRFSFAPLQLLHTVLDGASVSALSFSNIPYPISHLQRKRA